MTTRFSRFAAAALLAVVLAGTSSHDANTPSKQLSNTQEMTSVGAGFKCDFLSGAAAGLGVGTLFGCIPCGGAAAVGAAIYVVAC